MLFKNLVFQEISKFNPSQISRLRLWCDLDNPNVFVSASSLLYDKSRLRNNLVQANVSSRPVFSSINNKKSLFFDGVDDFILRSGFRFLRPGTFVGAFRFLPQNTTFGIAGENYKPIIHCDPLNTSYFVAIPNGGEVSGLQPLQLNVSVDGNTSTFSSPVIPIDESLVILSIVDNGSAVSVYLGDNTTPVVTGTSQASPSGDFTIAGKLTNPNNRTKGHYHEFVVYDKALTQIELTLLISYLINKWT